MSETEERISDGPTGDKEMPLTDHIDELRNRMVVVLIVFGAALLIVFTLYSKQIMVVMWNDLVSQEMGMMVLKSHVGVIILRWIRQMSNTVRRSGFCWRNMD